MDLLVGFLKRRAYFLLFLVFFVQIVLIFYLQRGIFLQRYDVSYWKDRFEHSQWQLPFSSRSIGDDGLYEYVGYTLANGADLSLVTAEVPPIGKYLIGFSIVLFGTPFVYTFFISLATLVVFFFLCNQVIKNTLFAILCTLFLFLDPLFYTQISMGTLDSTQLFFLLSHFLCLFLLPKKQSKKQFLLAGLAGMSLGLFIEVKLPILLPIIIVLDLWYLFRFSKKIIAIFLLAIGVAVFLPYTYYFMLHHSFIDFVRLQKYMLAFYIKSKLHTHYGGIITTMLFGKFPDIVSGALRPAREWWAIWPMLLVGGMVLAYRKIFVQKGSRIEKVCSVFALGAVGTISLVPFYTRYILPVLPFLYLLMFVFLSSQKKRIIMVVGILLIGMYGFIHTVFLLYPNPQHLVAAFSYNFSHGFFQDLYQEDLASTSRQGITRSQFFSVAHTAFMDAQVRSVSVDTKLQRVDFWAKEIQVPVVISYTTQDLGTFTQKKMLHLIQESGQWKIVWDWNVLFTGFRPGDRFVTTVIPGKRGSMISDATKQAYAQDTPGFLISVIPGKIDGKREEKMLKFFSILSGIKPVILQNAYLENSLRTDVVPLFTTFSVLSNEQLHQLQSFPGVLVVDYPSRLYTNYPSISLENTAYSECCSRVYSSWSYHGIDGMELQYDRELSGNNGGALRLEDASGNVLQTYIQKEAKNGRDVIVPL